MIKRLKKIPKFKQKQEIPSEWLKRSLRAAKRDRKLGYVSPAFDNVKDSIAWLKDPDAKYINGKYVHPRRIATKKKFSKK